MEALEDSLKDLTDTNQTRETFYFELPKLRLDRVIVPNSEIHDQCELSWSPEADVEYRARMEKYGVTSLPKDRFAYADQEYVKFKRDSQKKLIIWSKSLSVVRQLRVMLVLLLVALGSSIQRSFILTDITRIF